jgi:hypothetical protein
VWGVLCFVMALAPHCACAIRHKMHGVPSSTCRFARKSVFVLIPADMRPRFRVPPPPTTGGVRNGHLRVTSPSTQRSCSDARVRALRSWCRCVQFPWKESAKRGGGVCEGGGGGGATGMHTVRIVRERAPVTWLSSWPSADQLLQRTPRHNSTNPTKPKPPSPSQLNSTPYNVLPEDLRCVQEDYLGRLRHARRQRPARRTGGQAVQLRRQGCRARHRHRHRISRPRPAHGRLLIKRICGVGA